MRLLHRDFCPEFFVDPSLVADHGAFDHCILALLAIHQASALRINNIYNLVVMNGTSCLSILVYTYQSGAFTIKHHELVSAGKWFAGNTRNCEVLLH